MDASVQTWATVAQAVFAAVGVFFVVAELRRNTNLSKVQLIAQINDRLASYSDIAETLQALDDEASFAALTPALRERVLDYVSIFETIESMRQLRSLTAREIDYFFAGRFTDLVGRPGLQKAIFYNASIRDQLYPVFALHRHVLREREARSPKHPSVIALRNFALFDSEVYNKLAESH